jgi:hypothetical protein
MNLQNIEYDNELNLRLQKRNIPDTQLRPLFDFRPTPTKYTHFGMVEDYKKSTEPLFTYADYSPSTNFNPSHKGTTEFYLKSIDQESKLQNRFMALQKSDQAVYVPELSSSLYENSMAYQKTQYAGENVNYESRKPKGDLAPNQFFNHTRIKNIKQKI